MSSDEIPKWSCYHCGIVYGPDTCAYARQVLENGKTITVLMDSRCWVLTGVANEAKAS